MSNEVRAIVLVIGITILTGIIMAIPILTGIGFACGWDPGIMVFLVLSTTAETVVVGTCISDKCK